MTKLSPVLKEISDFMWEFEAENPSTPYGFDEEDLTHATKIFMAALMNVMFGNRGKKDLTQMIGLAEHVGGSVREIIKQACGVDMHEAIKKYQFNEDGN
jgi:hypothetical protein